MSALLDSQLGQLFILELKSAKWNAPVERLLRSIQPAGIVVPLDSIRPLAFLRDLAKGASSVLRGTPLIGTSGISVGALEPVLPSATDDGSSPVYSDKLKRRAEALGKMRGIILRNVGRNVDFSLWLDLAHPGRRMMKGFHAAERDPRLVAKCAGAYVRGLHLKNVVACAMDFPGKGSVELNRQLGGLLSAKPMAALWCKDLVPFRELLPKLPLVMVSHAAYKAYDFDLPRPAMWSSEVVTGLLRVKLGYKGVAVAGLSGVGVVTKDTDMGEAAVKALGAGCDLLIVPGNKSSIGSALRAVGAALDSGRLSAKRLEESVRRIRAMKRKLAEPLRVISEKTLRRAAREIRQCEKEMRRNE